MTNLLDELKKILPEENILVNEPMKNHTTFKVGGPADYLVMPETKEQIVECLKLDVPKFILGNGSNLIVKDGGIRGLVIKTSKLDNLELIEEDIIEAGAGCYLSVISNLAKKNSLTGFEFASGIPGTFGGAVMMNAGAYGGEMKDVVIETTYIDEDLEVKTTTEHEFSYRKSMFTNSNRVILSSKIKLAKGNYEEIDARIKELSEARRTKQPLSFPSAGSTFKRPEGYFAGKLIEDSDLKGFSIGGAQVSELHAGFVINKGGATAKDILDLIRHIQNEVKNRFGVDLETEVKIVGED
ncbi:MAG: UDP-N-acetylmuramate dehydrogenase [Clostridia bacterium]|nr:UDP-N-acetylmuramate dehydrogenase [Clostridia bacterium]